MDASLPLWQNSTVLMNKKQCLCDIKKGVQESANTLWTEIFSG